MIQDLNGDSRINTYHLISPDDVRCAITVLS